MNRTALLLLLAVAVLGGGLVAALLLGTDAGDAREAATPRALARDEAAPAPARPLAPSGEADEPGPTPAPTAVEPDRAALDAAGAVVDEAPDVLVLVVRAAADGAALPGAVVHCAEDPDLREHWAAARGRANPDTEAALERLGRRYEADENGEIEVPAPRATAYAVARAGELYGAARFARDADGGRVELLLHPDRHVAIRVRDAAGAPVADVPVGVALRTGNWEHLAWTARTDGEEGLAVARHFHELFGAYLDHGSLYARLAFPLADPEAVLLPPDELPREPVELTLPPTGAVLVELQQADGSPFAGACRVELSVDPGGRLGARHPTHALELDGDGEPARYDFVGLGLELVASARTRDGWKLVSERFAGPAAPGEERRVVLRFAQRWPALVGRALGPDGAPLAERALRVNARVRVNGADRGGRSGGATTDADGRFRWYVELEALREGVLAVELRAPAQAGAPELAASVDLPLPLDEGETALGDVALAGAALVVAGTVVDPLGRPIPDVRLGVAALQPGSDLRPDYWQQVAGLYTTSDAAGRFELRGTPPPGRLALRASAAHVVREEPAPFPLGAREYTLTLQRAGVLAGRVLVDPGVPAQRLRVRLRPPGRRERTSYGCDVMADGRFQARAVEPGDYDLHVHVESESEPLATVPGVRVAADGSSDDPRLDPVDLRGALHALVLRVTDEAGAPLDGAWVRYDPDGAGGADPIGRAVEGGRAVLVAKERALDLEVGAAGFRSARVEGASGEADVALARGYALRVRLRGAPPALGEAWLDAAADRRTEGRSEPSWFRAADMAYEAARQASESPRARLVDGEAVLYLPEPGSWTVRLDLMGRDERSSWSRSLPCSAVVEARDGPAEQVELDCDPAAIESALRWARQGAADGGR